MEINSTSAKLNLDIRRAADSVGDGQKSEKLNAFGIGEANKPQVELSPQAKILQQADQKQLQRQQSAPAKQQNDQEPSEQNNNFVRVSSSLGESAQANNLNSEKAAELYRSIEKLL